MPTMIDYGFPERRPNSILNLQWIGPDDDLALQGEYYDNAGQLRVIQWGTKINGGELCLPSSATVLDLSRDTAIAHVRMAMFLGNYRAWTIEAQNALITQSDAKYFQTPVGECRVVATRHGAQPGEVEFDLRKGTSGPILVVQTSVDELTRYALTPSSQLRIVCGSVKKQFSNYIHDYPGTVLTQSQKDDIVSYVASLAPWI